MKVWSLVSQKGGAGKSTLATQLAVVAWQAGERVAIVDYDRQNSAWHWSELRKGKAPQVARSLTGRLSKVIEAARGMDHTLVFIDTAPHTDDTAVEVIGVSDLIITPTKPAEFELAALKDTANILNLTGRLSLAVGVVNDVTPTKAAAAEYKHAAERMQAHGLRVCATYLCHRKAFTDAIALGKGVTEMPAKDNKAASEIKDLWAELLSLAPNNVISMKEQA